MHGTILRFKNHPRVAKPQCDWAHRVSPGRPDTSPGSQPSAVQSPERLRSPLWGDVSSMQLASVPPHSRLCAGRRRPPARGGPPGTTIGCVTSGVLFAPSTGGLPEALPPVTVTGWKRHGPFSCEVLAQTGRARTPVHSISMASRFPAPVCHWHLTQCFTFCV